MNDLLWTTQSPHLKSSTGCDSLTPSRALSRLETEVSPVTNHHIIRPRCFFPISLTDSRPWIKAMSRPSEHEIKKSKNHSKIWNCNSIFTPWAGNFFLCESRMRARSTTPFECGQCALIMECDTSPDNRPEYCSRSPFFYENSLRFTRGFFGWKKKYKSFPSCSSNLNMQIEMLKNWHKLCALPEPS